MTVNPLLQTLRLIDRLSQYPATSEALEREFEASAASVKRYLKEARELGADICSVRSNGIWVYELRNARSVMKRVKLWIELEEGRNLIA